MVFPYVDSAQVDLGELTQIPRSLPGASAPIRTTLGDDHTLNIKAITGSHHNKAVAVAFATLTTDKPDTLIVGTGADWWMAWYVNGRKTFSTLNSGNRTSDYALTNNIFALPLQKGKNVLAVKVIAGREGWRLMAGVTPRVRHKFARKDYVPRSHPLPVAQALSEDWSPDRASVYGLNYALDVTRKRVARGDSVATTSLATLLQKAKQALSTEPQSVTYQGQTPPSGDEHDYKSLPPYWWPNPDTDDGLPYVRRDGEVNPESENDDARPFHKMEHAVETLGLAYALTGRAPYAEHAAKLLRVWFLNKETRMNPNLNFGQGVPGRSEGRRYGIIETRDLAEFIEAIGMLAPSSAWTESNQRNLKRWMHSYLTWLVTSELGKKEAQKGNNHGVWYDAQVAALALFTDERKAARKVLRLSSRRIRSQVESDGRMPKELARTRSMTYTAMNTKGMTQLAALAQNIGVDLWHSTNTKKSSLTKAVDFLTFYADGTRSWPYEEIKHKPWNRISEILRKAARAHDNPAYEQLLRHVPEIDWRKLPFNLLAPPLQPPRPEQPSD